MNSIKQFLTTWLNVYDLNKDSKYYLMLNPPEFIISTHIDNYIIEEYKKVYTNNDRIELFKPKLNRIPKYLSIFKDNNNSVMPYYALRTNKKYINIKSLQLVQKYGDVKELFRIYTPNANKTWNSFCEKFALNIKKSTSQDWFEINITEQEFRTRLIVHNDNLINI